MYSLNEHLADKAVEENKESQVRVAYILVYERNETYKSNDNEGNVRKTATTKKSVRWKQQLGSKSDD